MGFLTKVDELAAFKKGVTDIILRHLKLLGNLSHQYASLLKQSGQLIEVSADVDYTLFINKIKSLDDAFEIKERELFKEYQDIITKHRQTLKLAEMVEQLELAVAEVRNKINVAVTFVQDQAAQLLEKAEHLPVSVAKTRLEYLSNLTLEKEIEIFEDVLKEPID